MARQLTRASIKKAAKKIECGRLNERTNDVTLQRRHDSNQQQRMETLSKMSLRNESEFSQAINSGLCGWKDKMDN